MEEQFDFESLPVRNDTGSMKYHWLPEGWAQRDLITFSGAELDLQTAPCIIQALTRRVQNGLYGYTLDDGPYLDAVSDWMRDVRDWNVDHSRIVPTYGISQALNCAIRAFTDPDGKVLIQPPTYHMYVKATHRNGRQIVENPLLYRDGYYEMDLDDLERKMSDPKVQLMVLCNPQNPIMDIWEKDTLSKVAELAEKYHVIVFSDEIFAEHSYAGVVTPYGQVDEENSIVLTSLGKAFNFTGVSHGNAIIPNEKVRNRFLKQRETDHFGSIDPFVYTAVRAAYTAEGKAWIDALLKFAGQNSKILTDFFTEYFPEVTCCRQRGGTLVWIDLNGWGMDEETLHRFLTEEALIQTDRGSIYGTGGECFTRMEMGMPRRYLETSLDRLLQAARKKGLTNK